MRQRASRLPAPPVKARVQRDRPARPARTCACAHEEASGHFRADDRSGIRLRRGGRASRRADCADVRRRCPGDLVGTTRSAADASDQSASPLRRYCGHVTLGSLVAALRRGGPRDLRLNSRRCNASGGAYRNAGQVGRPAPFSGLLAAGVRCGRIGTTSTLHELLRQQLDAGDLELAPPVSRSRNPGGSAGSASAGMSPWWMSPRRRRTGGRGRRSTSARRGAHHPDAAGHRCIRLLAHASATWASGQTNMTAGRVPWVW